MRPYVKRFARDWQQEGENVEITHEQLRYHKQNLLISMEENQMQLNFYRKLSFELNFEPH